MALILVVEDNALNLELMVCLLEAHGHRTLQAHDGLEGLALARSAVPDLVLCDLQMPGLDGWSVARTLRADPATAALPLVAVTAAAMVGDRERALAAGFDAHIAKPIDPAGFAGALEAVLQGAAGRPPRAAPAGTGCAAQVPEALCAPRPGLVLLMVDDRPVHQELKRDLLEPAGYSVRTAGGVDAAWSALQQGPADAVISDVVMPGQDGLALLRRVRADARLARLRFAFLTSTAREEADRLRALACGADAYWIRPVEPHRLLADLRGLLQA